MENLSQQLGIRKPFISPHHPQANGKLESLHIFIKSYVWKFSVNGVLGWDQFNLFPNEHSQESPHFLYFGQDSYLLHIAEFLQLNLRYLALEESMICIDKLRQAYMLAALNKREAHSMQIKQRYGDVPNYKIGDLVMIRNFDKKPTWDAKYVPNFRVVCLIGSRQLEISDPSDRTTKINVGDAHKIVLSDHIISSILDKKVFVRRGKYINYPRLLREVAIIDTFLHENFPQVRIRQK